MKRDTQEIAIFNLEYFLRFENFPGRAYRVTANFSVIIIIRWMFHQWVGVAFPHFSRVVLFLRAFPDLGQRKRIFHRRKNGKTTRPRSIKIEWHRGKKVRPMEMEHEENVSFFFPLFLSHPLCATNSPHSAVRPSFSSFALNGFSGDSFLSLSSLVGYPPRSNETREIVSLIRGFDIRGETWI